MVEPEFGTQIVNEHGEWTVAVQVAKAPFTRPLDSTKPADV